MFQFFTLEVFIYPSSCLTIFKGGPVELPQSIKPSAKFSPNRPSNGTMGGKDLSDVSDMRDMSDISDMNDMSHMDTAHTPDRIFI